jgi:hypothetical protein
MPNQRHSHYRGCAITTRWTEVTPRPEWLERDAVLHGSAKRFTASFSVEASVACDESWQQFPTAEFDTFARASEGAMTMARQMIDAKLFERSNTVRR